MIIFYLVTEQSEHICKYKGELCPSIGETLTLLIPNNQTWIVKGVNHILRNKKMTCDEENHSLQAVNLIVEEVI